METQKSSSSLDPITERPQRLRRDAEDGQARRGLIPTIVGLGVDVTEDGITGALGLADDVRRETRQLVVSSLDFADSVVRAFTGIGRRTVERFDHFTVDVLTGSERVAISTLSGLRSLTHNASALADAAARQVVGARGDQPLVPGN